MIKAVIVEDSRLARLELTSLLAGVDDITVVGEASNVDDALLLIDAERPDVIFLDINMPEKNGFDLLAALDDMPQVIFTTAYDQYAINAFEYNTLDYLLKPITATRLSQALVKLRERLPRKESDNAIDQRLTADSQFFVKDGEQCWLVNVGSVYLLESVGNYTRVYFDKNKPMILKPLTKVQERLPNTLFFRANRHQLINLSYIANVETSMKGGLELTLNSGNVVEVSRRQSTEFRSLYSL